VTDAVIRPTRNSSEDEIPERDGRTDRQTDTFAVAIRAAKSCLMTSTKFGEIAKNNGHSAVQGHSR